jgi:hypothetical protein
MKKLILFLTLISFFGLFAEYSFSDDVLTRVLPYQMKAEGFTTPYPYRIYDDQSLYGYLDGGAPFYLDRGFSKLIHEEYVAGKDSVIVDIYLMKDEKSTVDLFQALKRKESQVLRLGKEGQEAGNQIEFYQNTYFVRITAFKMDQKTRNTIMRMAEVTSKNISAVLNESKK